MKWQKLNERIWTFGEPELGCGVYKSSKGWTSNVVVYHDEFLPPIKKTKEEAMMTCERIFKDAYSRYHEEVN